VSLDAAIAKNLEGRFLVFDGPDGCGKTTQLALLAKELTGLGVEVVQTRDPGGTEISDRIRQVLLGYDLARMDVRCEILLFMASRAQLVSEVIRPALADRKTVLCSRFISASYAYQGAAGFDTTHLRELGDCAVGDCWPDLTIVLDVPVEQGFKRTGRKPHHAGANRDVRSGEQHLLIDDATVDAMEARPLAYHRNVREAFLALPGEYPKPVRIIDGTGSAREVFKRVTGTLADVVF